MKIIDFGLARATDHMLAQASMFTELGQILGTPEYMSPEQADLNNTDIDTRTDIYALGVMLYELLIGERPFPDLRTRGLLGGFDTGRGELLGVHALTGSRPASLGSRGIATAVVTPRKPRP